MKIRYSIDVKAPKNRHADKTVVVSRAVFTRIENRQYIVRNSPEYSSVRTVKFIHRQNHQSRYFEIANDLRPRFKPRTAEDFEW